MTDRFSSAELHHLRNDLPIENLIKALRIPWRSLQGQIFRFACPQCFGYHTAVHPRTNLSRCFNCRKNFNAIELVMLVKQLSFVASVKLLQKHQGRLAAIKRTPNQCSPTGGSRWPLVNRLHPPKQGTVFQPRREPGAACVGGITQPILIGEIFRQMALGRKPS